MYVLLKFILPDELLRNKLLAI